MTEEKSEQQSQTVALKYGLIVVVLIAVVSWLVMQGDEPKQEPEVAKPIEQPIEEMQVQAPAVVASELEESEPEQLPIEPEVDLTSPEEPETVILEAEPEVVKPKIESEPVQAITEIVEEEPEPEPVSQHYSNWLLPKLDQLLVEPDLLSLIIKPQVVENFVVFIDNAAAGSVARDFSILKAPKGKFSVTQPQMAEFGKMTYVADEKSYDRYNLHAQVLTLIPTDFLVEIYQKLQPDMEQAYQQIGYSDFDFNEKLLVVIDQMLSVPVLIEAPALVSPSAMYEYADPELESLNDLQKLLLRMGPDNVRLVQSKLRELQNELTK